MQRRFTDRSVQSAPAERSFLGTFFGWRRPLRAPPQRPQERPGVRQAIPSYNLEFPKLKEYLEGEFGDVGIFKTMVSWVSPRWGARC
jgi:hypothetical protein